MVSKAKAGLCSMLLPTGTAILWQRFTMEESTSVVAPLSYVQEPLIALPLPQQQAGVPSSAVPANLVRAHGASAVVNSAAPVPHSVFCTAAVDVPAAMSLGNLTTYNEVVNRLNRLFEDQTRDMEELTDDHWKSQEFPLARIKKIMRMDEEVKMISAEVPIMFSKAVEIFISELTLRSWMHTEEAKRRTVQRTDIAMAITKNDMFDFLIDIVPREEIQMKTKTTLKAGESENVQLLSPDLLQLCLQQLAQQTVASAGGGGEEDEEQMQATATATKLVEQQLHLLQQLINLQQMQQAQDLEQQSHQIGSGGTVHLQHPPQDQSVLEQPHTLSAAAAGMAVGTQPVTSLDLSGVVQPQATQVVSLSGGQQTLHHVDVAVDVEQQLLTAQSQQQQPGTTVVQLLEGTQPTLMDTSVRGGPYQLQHLSMEQQQEIQQLQQVVNVQQVMIPAEQIPDHFTGSGVQTSEGEMVEFRHIPESESISRSISPIAATLQSAREGVPYSSHAQQTVPIPASPSSSACVLQPPVSGAVETVGTTVTLRNLQSSMTSS